MSSSVLLALEPRRARGDRSADRWVTVAAIAIAIAYLLAGAASTLLPSGVRGGTWLPLHRAATRPSIARSGAHSGGSRRRGSRP